MSRIIAIVTMKLLSDAIPGSGNSAPGGEDIGLRVDLQGKPFFPGSALKGLFRENLENYLCWTDSENAETVNDLIGAPGWDGSDSPRRVIFTDLHPTNLVDNWSSLRTFTALENGVVKGKTLRTAACLHAGLELEGRLIFDEQDYALVENALRGIQWVGLLRNRGFGHVQMKLQWEAEMPVLPEIGPSHTVHYRLTVETPVAMPWFSRSDAVLGSERNFTESRAYITGSAIRGFVLSQLAKEDSEWFETNKRELLQDVYFSNVLPMAGVHTQIPTPIGYYSDKMGASFYSSLLEEHKPGDKPARMGQYCYVEQNRIVDSPAVLETSLRIQRGTEKKMFTMRAIAAGTVLEGVIHLENANLAPKVAGAFRQWITLGSGKYAGFGLCKVELDRELPAYAAYSYGKEDTIPDSLYLLLLAPATMINADGEPVGLDEAQFAELLGVERVRIDCCATAMTETGGFNRTLGCALPMLSMYDMGSIFCLKCGSAPSWEAIHKLEQNGLGIRREEGYGQVLFLKDYPAWSRAVKEVGEWTAETSDRIRFRQARCRWLLGKKLNADLSKSQIGNFQAICESVLYGGKEYKSIQRFFEHNIENRTSNPNLYTKYEKFEKEVNAVLNKPLSETLQCPGYPESQEEKLKLLCDLFDLSRKGEK